MPFGLRRLADSVCAGQKVETVLAAASRNRRRHRVSAGIGGCDRPPVQSRLAGVLNAVGIDVGELDAADAAADRRGGRDLILIDAEQTARATALTVEGAQSSRRNVPGL